ncbi:DNA-binding transcriptional activator of the SARP family [Amycolatopsis arida]|uniref:DNA-binding transcriptional activator of the SARP family n=1 Tax=Amycolatopsis arida TaxID=587909 RepID=A0A1I6AQG1_9PSEU|nr:BTAD domain-containing putative transcriptional regulator [Amycolatopsis arida]TDX97615.1 DNA-binding SARP family transcriptional activator [Amycolatopsis arida]SFQ70933.1 DNA-binding transcriptional activator of the SARP family [Amycolatopsis arida]
MSTADVDYRVLGPLEVERNGRPVSVPAGKQRVILALLLLHHDRMVTVEELVDKTWGARPPADGRAVVQKYVMRLRRILPKEAIRTEDGGYRLVLPSRGADLSRFTDLVERARTAAAEGDREAESTLLTKAVAEWRGVPPLANVPSDALARDEIPRLVERYLQAMERRIEVDLELGRHGDVVGELMGLVREHPLRERFWAQLLRALHGCGRQGEALNAFREVTRLLADELGVDPGPELRETHRRILRDLDEPPEVPRRSAEETRCRRPRQLPMATAHFVGRREEIERLTALLGATGDALTPPVVVITGPAGVGKTALAVHVAHRVAARFGDGQLFADLRAYGTTAPLSREEVLGQFLRALGLAPDATPLALGEQVSLFRSLMAGRRMLVVLDNIATEEQVRALLPASPGCAVLVTSRHELGGLAVDPGVQRLRLGELTTAESLDLLVTLVGDDRVSDESESAGDLVVSCGRLALAMRIAAAHLALRPQLKIGDYVAQLRSGSALSLLRLEGDERADVSAALNWSYRVLSPEQRRMLRLVSLVPGPDFGVEAVAALCAVPPSTAGDCLDQLVAASLLDRTASGRYRLHDLVRDYARQRGLREDPDDERSAAHRRLLDYYIAVTDAAVRPLLTMNPLPRPPSVTSLDVGARSLDSVDEERPALVAAVRDAAERGPYQAACHLADALRGYFTLRGHTVDWLTTVDAGLRAARRVGYDEGVAAMLNGRGGLRYYSGDTGAALRDLTAALRLYERLGLPGANAARINLGIIAQVSGDLARAVEHLEAALRGYRAAGDATLERRARENLVLSLLELGELRRARRECAPLREDAATPPVPGQPGVPAMLAHYTEELPRARRLLIESLDEALARGDQRTSVGLRDELANCLLELGDVDEAYRQAKQGLADAERNQDVRNTPNTHTTFAQILRVMGQDDDAAFHYDEALASARDMRSPNLECGALIGLAELRLAADDIPEATALATQAVLIARGSRRRLRLVQALTVLSACERAMGNPCRARELAEEARELAHDCEYPLGQALALEQLAEVSAVVGERDAAISGWREVEHRYRELGSRRAAHVARRLVATRCG